MCSTTGRILLNLRSPHKTHKLTWSLWGGMAEGDESPAECLRREITEEMGFMPPVDKIYPFDVFESRDKDFRYYTFVCVVEGEFIPQLNNEAVGYGWCNLGVWPTPLHEGVRSSFASRKAQSLLEIILSQHQAIKENHRSYDK